MGGNLPDVARLHSGPQPRKSIAPRHPASGLAGHGGLRRESGLLEDLRAGLRHPVSDSFRVVWGIRWEIREAPTDAYIERLTGYAPHGASMLSLEAALTLTP